MQPAPPKAGIYCRMSLAIMNDTTKVTDQERICRDLARRLGWDITGVYSDNNKSAWRKNRKRPGWDQMLADIEMGRLTAIVVYHGDRLIRQPFDLETLINLAEGKGIRLAAPTGTRDLDNKDDHFILRIEAAMACRESDNTSRRRKAQYARWRREGRVRPGGRGGRAYGFATDGQTHIERECRCLREAATRILAGHPTGAVTRWLNSEGQRTPTGRPFGHATVRKMLARPRYAGLMPDGQHPAAWEPVYDTDRARATEIWQAVCVVLDARAAGHAYATNARRYLLSGLCLCGACGSALQIRDEGRRVHPATGAQCTRTTCTLAHQWRPYPAAAGYGCVKPGCRKVQRSMHHLDTYVTTRVLDRLAHPANPPGQLPGGTAAAAELRTLMQLRADTEAQVADYAAAPARIDLLMRRLDSLDTRLAELRALAAGDARTRLLQAHAGLTRDGFTALPLATQRALVSACYTITVLPTGRRGPGFDPAAVRLAPR
jgi:site-specific DNA recombinase